MNLLLLPLLLILAVCVIGALVLVYRRREALEKLRRSEDQATIDLEKRTHDGTTVAELPARPAAERWYGRFNERPRWPIAMAGLLALVLLLGGYAIWQQGQAESPARFLVLVAPFDDGGDGSTGRNIAAALVRQIAQQARGDLVVEQLDAAPADPAAALATATARGADLLIYGGVEPGAILDSASLLPRLIYTPSGPYGPNSWDAYAGRFAMPRSYSLAAAPINGQAVLLPLVQALYDYARGEPDLADGTLGRLLADYPALNPGLPQALRGNVRWARGLYADAAAAYRAAQAGGADEPALLANNLGAILFDNNDPAALAAFAEAVRLLGGRDLGELRVNLALLALREQRPADAVVELEQARNLVAVSAPTLIDLALAYRESGRLAEARATLLAAEEQRDRDVARVPGPLVAGYRERVDASLREQRALLALAERLGAQGPLLWELEAARPLLANQLAPLRDELRSAAELTERAVARWRQRAVSAAAARPGSDLVALGQAERVERNAQRQRFYTAVLSAEIDNVPGGRRPNSLGRLLGILFTGTTPVGGSVATLSTLRDISPDSPEILAALGRAYRIAGQLDEADRTYLELTQLAPQRPEGFYGQAMVARDRGDRDGARRLLGAALERSGAFFPARVALAALAEEQQDWAAAIDQRRALASQRPGAESAVALAQDLRRGGPDGYVEAEQVLLPYSLSSPLAAIELGRLYSDAGRPDAAVGAYQDALALDPDSATAAFELGERLAASGDYAGAERYLRDALRIDREHIQARLALARLYQGPLDQPAAAAREYRTALDQGLDQVDQLLLVGEAALAPEVANPQQAILALEAARNIDAGNPTVQHRLGQAYLAAGRLAAARAAEARALELLGPEGDPALRAEVLIALGDVARREGQMAEASERYNQALGLNPQLIPAEIGLGLVAVGQGTWGVALGYFERAVGLPGGAESPEAHFWLAEALLRSGDLSRASAAYARAIELRPDFPEAYLGLGQLRQAQGDLAGALETINTGLGLRPGYAEGLLFKGKLLQELGRNAEALAAYNDSIRANGTIAETHFRRGVLQIGNASYDAALRDLGRAVQLQPNFPEAHYWLGRAYYAQGRLESALSALERASSQNGNYSEAIFYRGLVAEDLGRRDEAISAYQTVIQIDPNSDLATRAQVQLAQLN